MLRSSVLTLLAAAGLPAGCPPTESQVGDLRHLGGPCTGKTVVNPRGEIFATVPGLLVVRTHRKPPPATELRSQFLRWARQIGRPLSTSYLAEIA
jgi:hypothetical protein